MPFIIAPLASGLTALGIGAAASTAIAKFAVSFLLNAASAAILTKKPKAQQVAQDLAQPSTEPAYRFPYGIHRATGTNVGQPAVKEMLYGCWILSSRISALDTISLFVDKREVTFTGDPYDFSGPGAEGTNGLFNDHIKFWISRGDQTSPPDVFLNECPWEENVHEDRWKASDQWRGRTTIWVRCKGGGKEKRPRRWPSWPNVPNVEVEGKFTRVRDIRNPAHLPNDESTWEWSDNHALCVRDALRNHPVRPYTEDQLLESFEDGADISDELVPLKSGGSERRYRCAGVMVFGDGEMEDHINPLVISGGADLIRIGGRLGYAAGAYRAPTETVNYILGDSFEFPDMVPGDDLGNQLRVSYLSPARGYETAELNPWDIPGALAEDGGVPSVRTLDLPFCPSATQAMRIRKIFGLRHRRQQRLRGGELPPELFNLVGGSTANVALSAPFDVLDGIYEVEAIHPGLDPLGDEACAMRLPATLVKHSSDIYVWNGLAEEEDVFDEDFDQDPEEQPPVDALTVTTGQTVNRTTGDAIIPRGLIEFDPVEEGDPDNYRWEFRPTGGDYEQGGVVAATVRNGMGKVFFYLEGEAGQTYDVRVFVNGSYGESDPEEVTGVLLSVDIDLPEPILSDLTINDGFIRVTYVGPNDPDYVGGEVYGSDTDDVNTATLLFGPFYGPRTEGFGGAEGPFPANTTRYYFARSIGPFGLKSDFTASTSATVPSPPPA